MRRRYSSPNLLNSSPARFNLTQLTEDRAVKTHLEKSQSRIKISTFAQRTGLLLRSNLIAAADAYSFDEIISKQDFERHFSGYFNWDGSGRAGFTTGCHSRFLVNPNDFGSFARPIRNLLPRVRRIRFRRRRLRVLIGLCCGAALHSNEF